MGTSFNEQLNPNAHIIELPTEVTDKIEPTAQERCGGDYFPTALRWLPHVGDLINLYSRINAAKGLDPIRRYEVVRISHILNDVNEDSQNPEERRGSHTVQVFVRLSSDKLFTDDVFDDDEIA